MVEMQELDSLSYVWEGSSVQVKTVCRDEIPCFENSDSG